MKRKNWTAVTVWFQDAAAAADTDQGADGKLGGNFLTERTTATAKKRQRREARNPIKYYKADCKCEAGAGSDRSTYLMTWKSVL